MSESSAAFTTSRRRLVFWVAVVVILLLAWALRLQRLDFQDIWWDEARNIEVATRAYSVIAGAPELDIHPPAYFYALHLWTALVGATAFSARFFSVWFGLLTVALVYRLGRELHSPASGKTVGLLALMLSAFAPYALSEAQETRMYTISWAMLTVGMLSLWWALAAPLDSIRTVLKRWTPFVLLTALALLTHYATAMIFVTWGAWLFIWALIGPQRWRRLLLLLCVGLATALLFAPVLPIAMRQIPVYDNPNLVLPDLQSYLGQLYQAFIVGEFMPINIWSATWWLWLFAVAGGAILWIRKAPNVKSTQVDWKRWSLLAVWLCGGLLVFYVILVVRSAFNPRYISFVLPPLWALSGWALYGWRRLFWPLPWLIAAVLLGLTAFSLRADLYDPAHFREDAGGVVAYLEANATPDDVILVDQRYPFGFYWQRWNRDFYGLPPSEPAGQTPAQYLFVDMTHNDERRIDRRLTELAGSAQRVYWLTWFESDMDPRGAVASMLDAEGERIATEQFRGYKVDVWKLAPPVSFALADDYQDIGLQFEPGITLVDGDWSGRRERALGGHPALVALRWQTSAPTARPLKVSLRLKDDAGKTLAQDDRLLLSDRHLRTTEWAAGESALNVYSLNLPLEPGEYQITLVVYDEETLEAYGMSDGSGIESVIGTIAVGEL